MSFIHSGHSRPVHFVVHEVTAKKQILLHCLDTFSVRLLLALLCVYEVHESDHMVKSNRLPRKLYFITRQVVEHRRLQNRQIHWDSRKR